MVTDNTQEARAAAKQLLSQLRQAHDAMPAPVSQSRSVMANWQKTSCHASNGMQELAAVASATGGPFESILLKALVSVLEHAVSPNADHPV